jgi:hypothetical protein
MDFCRRSATDCERVIGERLEACVFSPFHGAGTTIVHGCSFFVFAAASRQAPSASELFVDNLPVPMSTRQASGFCACINAAPAFQRSVCKMNAATQPSSPNGNSRAKSGEISKPTSRANNPVQCNCSNCFCWPRSDPTGRKTRAAL